jgi:hypothetical protein
MTMRSLLTALLIIAATALSCGQVGVVSAEPPGANDPHCQVYISPQIVLTFSLDVHDQPFLNVINYTDQEVVIQAENLSFLLADGRRVQPSLIKIATGQKDDFILRQYFTVKAHSNFHFLLAGLEEQLQQIDGLDVTIYPWTYHLAKVRRDFFDILLDRLEHVGLDEKSISRAFRKQDIPLKGSRERK